MKKVLISDVTLRENTLSDVKLSFKEKIEIAKQLDKLNVDIIETAKIENEKTDTLFLHTISPLIKNSIISCPVGFSDEDIEKTFDAIKGASKKRLHLMVPTSTVQMEFVCHKKPKAVLEMIDALAKKCVSLCDDVEFSALDATRSEHGFLISAIQTAVDAGIKNITICDTSGTMLPEEFGNFVKGITEGINNADDVTFGVEASENMDMGTACSIEAVLNGSRLIKTSVTKSSVPSLEAVACVLKTKGDDMGVSYGVSTTALNHSVKTLTSMIATKKNPYFENTDSINTFTDKLTDDMDITTVSAYIEKLGYDLNEEDIKKVYDEFVKVASKKEIGSKELDAIIASVALQIPSTYKLKSYVINNGNIITATACIELEKDGEIFQGYSTGDGPVAAAFMAIEQVVGHHYELDDFQIQSVTEGREAVGSSIVKLRSMGKLYSGKGISRDIIGASIKAYLNALNKIIFEENE